MNRAYKGFEVKRMYRQWVIKVNGTEAGFATMPELKAYIDRLEKEREDLEICPECGTEMKEHWENNGFIMPEGPEKWEVTNLYCPKCGHKED